jgi:signal transduction histidine kinase
MMQAAMTESVQSTGRSLKETLLLVGSSEAFTKRVILWTLPIGLFVAVFYDGNRFGTSRWGWLVAGLVAHAVATIIMFVLRQILLPKGPYNSAVLRTLAIFVAGSSTRSSVIGLVTYQLDLAESPLFGYRIFAGSLIGTLTLSMITIIAAVAKEHAQTQAQLDSERIALLNAEHSAQESIERQRLEIQGILQDSVEPALNEIAKNLTDPVIYSSTDLKRSAEKITIFIDSKLRPLAESFHQRKVVEVPDVSPKRANPSLASIPKFVTLRTVTSPLAIYLVLIGPNTTGLYPYHGYISLLLVVVMFLPMLFIQMGVLAMPFARRPIPGRLAMLVLVILFATSWLPAIYIAELFNIDIIFQFNLLPTLIVGTTLAGLIVTYGFIIDQERIRYESELFEANQALELELNRTAQQVWLLRQHAAQILHGSVQSSLTVANMRIRGAVEVDDALLTRVREDVERASIAISSFGNNEIKLDESLIQISDLWQGVCEVDFDYSQELMASIPNDSVTAHCINEIVKECVSNAIRHGQASKVKVSFFDSQDGSISISVTNNGDAKISSEQGVGSQMLDEITMGWSRELTESGVQVLAKVAVS